MTRPTEPVLAPVARRLGAVRGWRRAGAGALLGVCATLAMPPFFLLPLAVVAFTGLYWLAAGSRSAPAAFADGFWFGLGHFVSGLYWVAHAFAVAGVALWLAPIAVLALAATCALFPGLAMLVMRAAGATGAAGVAAMATAWAGGEWLRAFAILGGFPWNPAGLVWTAATPAIQLAALVGAFGLSWLTVLAAAAPAVLAERRGWRPVAVAWGLVALAVGVGAVRLGIAPSAPVPGVSLRLVQANIAQFHKWRDDLRESHLAKHLALSAAPGAPPPSHVIWAETSAPYVLATSPEVRARIARVAPAGGAVITGALRTETSEVDGFRVWNSLQAVDDQGRIVATYDKARLVPFGEYMPLRAILGLAKLTHGETDFSRGPGPRTLAIPALPPVSALICYEAIFPGRVVDAHARPDWLLNVTNDGWYGISPGPYQHFEQARLRAVEEGLALVRVANTGISGVVDPYGRVIARLGLGVEGVLDAALPARAELRTPYSRLGDWPLLVVALAVAAWCRRQRRRRAAESLGG